MKLIAGSVVLLYTCFIADVKSDLMTLHHPREPKIEDYDESFSEFLREILENFRDQMETGIPEISVPPIDPLNIPNISVDVKDGTADLVLRMRNLTITGIKAFQMDTLKADLEKGFVDFNLYLPLLRATGFCYMDGKILGIFPLSGNGDFFIEVRDVNMKGYGDLNYTTGENVKLHMNDLKLSLTFGPLVIEFTSLLGGGSWTQTLLKLLTGLGGNIFMHFHPLAMKELNQALLKVINKELDKGTLKDLLDKIPLPMANARNSDIYHKMKKYLSHQ